MSSEARRRANALVTIKNLGHLRAHAAQASAASRDWFFAQPPEKRAYIVSRLVADGIRAAAMKRGLPPPIIFERERIDLTDDNRTITIDTAKLQAACDAEQPDPRLYKKLEGGGYAYIPALEEWEGNTEAIRRRRRNERRRTRRKARREAGNAADG
jgi:hypothetical protein